MHIGENFLYLVGEDKIRDGDWEGYEYQAINAWRKHTWENMQRDLSYVYSIREMDIDQEENTIYVGINQGECPLRKTTEDLKGKLIKIPNRDISGGINCLLSIPQCRYLVVCDWEKTLILKPSKTLSKEMRTLKIIPIEGFKIRFNSKVFAILSEDNQITLWDVSKWNHYGTLSGFNSDEKIIDFILSEENICVAITEDKLYLWKIPQK